MQSSMSGDVTLVRSMVTTYIKHQVIFIQRLLHGRSRCGEWTSLDPSAHKYPKDISLY